MITLADAAKRIQARTDAIGHLDPSATPNEVYGLLASDLELTTAGLEDVARDGAAAYAIAFARQASMGGLDLGAVSSMFAEATARGIAIGAMFIQMRADAGEIQVSRKEGGN